MAWIAVGAILWMNVSSLVFAGVDQLDYPGFSIWVNCETKALVKFQYILEADSGNYRRVRSYSIDPNYPTKCQQTSTGTYGSGFDRGHMVPANHMDSSEVSIKSTNFMVNIMPQTAQLNRGAWYQTEEIGECYREQSDLLIIGGPIWSDDYEYANVVKNSHGLIVPSAYWKVMIRLDQPDKETIAWILPNSKDAYKNRLDEYLVAPMEIEQLLGEHLPITEQMRHYKPENSWGIPIDCDRS